MNDNEKIKLLRNINNITQQELADKLDISKQYISQLETGVCPASAKVKKKIIKEFGLPNDFFISDVSINVGNYSGNIIGDVSLSSDALKTLKAFVEELKKCTGAISNKPVSEYYALLTDKGKLTVDNIIKTIYEQEERDRLTHKKEGENKNDD